MASEPKSLSLETWGPQARNEGTAAFTQLQAFLSQFDPQDRRQLPPERELCDLLGVSRGALRKALAQAEREGRIWRHVGKGTFFGSKPVMDLSDVASVARRASPAEVLRARAVLEPALAHEAAMHASSDDLRELASCEQNGRSADTWRRYENWDNRFHRAVASASQNKVLLLLFDNLNNVRRTMAWGRLRADSAVPHAGHHSFAEHARIVQAISDRDAEAASAAMKAHIEAVSRKLLEGATPG